MSGTFSQGGDATIQGVSQAAGADGISTGGHSTQPPTHEAVSAVGCVAQSDPNSSELARETLASGDISAAVRPAVASAFLQISPDAAPEPPPHVVHIMANGARLRIGV